MTVLTTAEDRTEDPAASDIHNRFLDVRPSVEVDTLVTLTGTEEVTSHRVSLHLLHSTRNAQRTATHVDSSRAIYVSTLVTAIDTGQNMTALDIHNGIAIHRSRRAEP